MKKDATNRALRLTKRNALISTVFYELTNQEGFGFMQAYVFLEEIFGIDERQIRKIIRQIAKRTDAKFFLEALGALWAHAREIHYRSVEYV